MGEALPPPANTHTLELGLETQMEMLSLKWDLQEWWNKGVGGRGAKGKAYAEGKVYGYTKET